MTSRGRTLEDKICLFFMTAASLWECNWYFFSQKNILKILFKGSFKEGGGKAFWSQPQDGMCARNQNMKIYLFHNGLGWYASSSENRWIIDCYLWAWSLLSPFAHTNIWTVWLLVVRFFSYSAWLGWKKST